MPDARLVPNFPPGISRKNISGMPDYMKCLIIYVVKCLMSCTNIYASLERTAAKKKKIKKFPGTGPPGIHKIKKKIFFSTADRAMY